MAGKLALTKEKVEKATFTYRKGTVHLDFTLRIDTDEELLDFKELLEAALEDVKKKIKN